MLTKRKRVTHHRVVPDDELQRFHVETGDCLLAGSPDKARACGLRRPDGTEDETAIQAARVRLGIPEGHADAE